MMYDIKINRAEFVRRLHRLDDAITEYIACRNHSDLYPALFSVYSYMWGRRADDILYKK